MTDPAGGPAWEASGGAAYESLIEDQLVEERKRKESLEQRAAFALTSGGGFVTLTLGIAALVTKAQEFTLPESARTLLLAAVIAFGLSAAAAIAANVPFRYLEVDEADIRASVETYWDGSRLWAEQAVSLALIDVLEAARRETEQRRSSSFLRYSLRRRRSGSSPEPRGLCSPEPNGTARRRPTGPSARAP